jgi:type II secretory pathway pseudopilin PulG
VLSANRIFPRRLLHGEDAERGITMIATMSVVLILGVLAVIAISGTQPSTPAGPSVGGSGTTTTVPTSPSNGASVAALAACKADFESVTAALQTYRTLNGASPPSGSAWISSPTNGGPFLQSWPTNTSFSLTWSGASLSVIPSKGRASHGSFGTSSPKTGCFASYLSNARISR